MKIFYAPINLNVWNLFAHRVDDIEDFSYLDGMKVGDMLLLYVTQAGIDDLRKNKPNEYDICPVKSPGIYACARIISLPYICANVSDYLCGEKVIDAKINFVSMDIPIVQLKSLPKGLKYNKPQPTTIGVIDL